MNSVNKQQQPGTCGGTAPNEQQNSSKNGPTPPVVGSTGLFLNVAHLMVCSFSHTLLI
jgi:hypothetical protein